MTDDDGDDVNIATFQADIDNLENLDDAHLDEDHLDDATLNDFFYEDELATPEQPRTPNDRSTRQYEIASSSTSSRSWVWEYYSKDTNPIFALCSLCRTKVNRGKDMSTGPLMRHLQRKHDRVYRQHLSAKALLRLSQSSSMHTTITDSTGDSAISSTLTLDPFFINCPSFDDCLLKWMISSYQPLRIVEDPYFRRMCQSLNKKAPIISRDKIKALLAERFQLTVEMTKNILKGQHFSFTTDGWTSLANIGYVTCTAHFIDRTTWKLHSFVMGLYEKDGGSRHEDIVDYCETQLSFFNLPYSHAVAVVTDTENTMVAAGRLFVQHSAEANGSTKWLGCIDHLLQLVTKKAFSDLPNSEGTMRAARNVVHFFNSSPQALKKLRDKQVEGRALVPIQDVVTRWWSTYSMCDRLLVLRGYINLLSAEGELSFTDLTDRQWDIIVDLHFLLKPFMIAQRLLEGEVYVTVSLVPYMIYKMRKGLQTLIDLDTSSPYVRSIAREMLVIFNRNFGEGADGTVATENLVLGERSRPKGLNMLILMASLLDPRMKGGVGLSMEDQAVIYLHIRDALLRIAAEAREQQDDNEEFPAERPVQPLQNNNRQHINNNFDIDMFDEINLLHNAQVRRPLEAVDQQQLHVEEIVDAELALYKDEPTISMFSTPGVYNDPLQWWRLNTRKYKLLSTLASRILCIPATSAPSERVFSVAGLTIAKDRARLASGTANDLIFLHEAIPAIEKYNISIGGGMV